VSDGAVLVQQWRDVIRADVGWNYMALQDRFGVFDCYRNDGTAVVRNWRDTVKFQVSYSFVALLDRFGVLQAYRMSDGFELLNQSNVQDIKTTWNGINYLQRGQWNLFRVD
jgi:hypothetical protein